MKEAVTDREQAQEIGGSHDTANKDLHLLGYDTM
jgi:hypothetical protein